MRCKSIEYNLPDYLQGALDAETAAALEAHLRHCNACARLRDELSPLFTLLDFSKRTAMTQQPGPDFLVAVNRKLDAPAARWSPGPVFLRLGIPATAMMLLLLSVALLRPVLAPLLPEGSHDAEMHALVESMSTTQLAAVREDLETPGHLLGIPGEGYAAPADAEPFEASVASVFNELSYGELVDGSSRFLSSDDVLDIAADAAADTFPGSVQ